MDYLEEGDSCDEIIEATTGKPTPKTTAKDGGTPCPLSKALFKSIAKEVLGYHLEWEPNVRVDPSEERDLIRKFQAGDKPAGNRLVRGRIAWLKSKEVCGQSK